MGIGITENNDMLLDAAKQEFREYIFGVMMKSIIKKYAFAAVGISNMFIGYFVGKLATAMAENAELVAKDIQIDKITDEEAKDFTEAARNLEEVKKNGSDEDIAKAEQRKIDEARKLIKFGYKRKSRT